MKAKPISSKVITTVGILTLLLLGATGGFLYLIHAKSNRVIELHQLLNDEINLNASLDASKQVIKETEKERDIINGYFVKESNVVGFLEFLENIGHTVGANIKITTVTTEKPVNENDKQKLALSIDMRGTWTSVLRYIKLLEAVPYNVEVEEVNINSLGVGELPDNSKPEWSGTIRIKVLMSV